MITESNKLLNDIIDSWTESLTERLIEIRFFNVAEIKTSLKVHFKIAMLECLKMQITNAETERKEKIERLKFAKGISKVKIQQSLAEVNYRLKAENKLYAELDRDRQAKEMILWMREHHPESILLFYKMYNEKFPERTK